MDPRRLPSKWRALPALLAPAFPRVREEHVAALEAFSGSFVEAVLLQDELLDGTFAAGDAGAIAARARALFLEAHVILASLFAPAARFWSRYRDYLADHARAYLVERAFRRGERLLAEYTETVALRAAADKIGLARIVVAALAELEGDDGLLAPTCDALERVGLAMGMQDDLVDWRSDLCLAQPSLLLARAVGALPSSADERRALQPRAARAILFGGHARYVLELGVRALDDAARLEEIAPGLPWYAVTRELRRHLERRLAILAAAADRMHSARPGDLPRHRS